MPKKKLPKTIWEFAQTARNMSNEDIYILFEDDIDKELQASIYGMADPSSPEPCRAAMEAIGYAYDIQSLINY